MTVWETDPDGVLVNDCRVRIGDGPHEGTWSGDSCWIGYAGTVTTDEGRVNVPLGCPVTVLREDVPHEATCPDPLPGDGEPAQCRCLRSLVLDARSWARHGYEIGQRSCTWSDHGVAPTWLTHLVPATSDADR